MINKIRIDKNDELYPEKLRKIRNSPDKIYALGNLNLLKEKSFSIVGSRGLTEYGEKYEKRICKEFALRDIPIVSGMAIGADTIAHSTALIYKGKTIAVLPCGFDNILLSSMYTPGITTIEQPCYEIGRTVVTELINNIQNEEKNNKQIKLPYKLIERESVKPVK